MAVEGDSGRAVVLGGGGLSGVAWLTGPALRLRGRRDLVRLVPTWCWTHPPSVVASQVVSGRPFSPVLSRAALTRELDELRAGGATVVEVEPDDASVEAMGAGDQLNPEHLVPSAVAGRAQGLRETERMHAVWSPGG